MNRTCKDYSVSSARSKDGAVEIYTLRNSAEDRNLGYREVLHLWQHDSDFTGFFCAVFRSVTHKSYVWETPPLSFELLDREFEFAIINRTPRSQPTASLSPASVPDLLTFKEYFSPNAIDNGVVAFPNIGKDAMLVVPSPLQKNANYAGLAEFFTNAPARQQTSLWKVLAREIHHRLSDQCIWVSVAGGGVAWLHIRIDSAPKYYRHLPYTRVK